ncbi:MAG: glycoside hydrolase family 26 protein [Bacteroidales bacterium]|nr:glycoside hydrolase family 26 protein [Bacteroidales bacterium]
MQATPATQELSRRMKRLLEKGVMFGHQDDTAYGHDWYGENGRSDVRDVTGDYPAVIGWELGHVELGVDCNLDSIYFSDMKRLMCENHTRGGINTVSWHGDNIVTGKTAWDCAQDYVVKSVLDGDNHEKFLTWLDRLADFFLDLKDENGELLPVIFRMYHEHTGAWFWWGARQCTPDEYSELYRMTVSYLRDVRNVHNLLYAFSPADVLSEADFLSRYPGDNWVDIIGFDTYCADNRDEYRKKVTSGLTVLTNYAARTGQIPVLAETGLEGITDSTFFSETLLPLIKPFKIGYVLCWRNAFNRPEHFYVPYKGHPAEQDFLKFVNSEQILMNKDL